LANSSMMRFGPVVMRLSFAVVGVANEGRSL
jgi:hypothetical protein